MAVSHENISGAVRPPLGQQGSHGAAIPNASNGRDVLEYHAELEATLPPTPVQELLAASGATIFLLATDPAFVATIRRAADRHPLFVVETWRALEEAVESGRCGIALLDAALLGSRVADRIAALHPYANRLVTLVAADRATAPDYVGLLSDGRIHRLLIKPPAVGAARLLIESATARRLLLREEHANDTPSEVAAARRLVPKWGLAAAAAVGAVALLGTAIVGYRAGWFDEQEIVAVPAPAPAAGPEVVPTTEEQVAEQHAQAALARDEGRLAEPVGASALDHYLAILALSPSDQAARSGVSSVVEGLFARAEEALLADSLETAAGVLDHVRRADPTSSRLAFLDAQLARALAALAASSPESATAASAPAVAATELDSVLSLATARLRRGQLIVPEGDSARAYLDRAAQLDATDSRVAALRADLAAALMATARLVAVSDVAAATTLTREARQVGAEPALLAALERDVAAARAREDQRRVTERLETARVRVREGARFAPPSESALAHLTRLQSDAPELAGLAEVWEELRQAAVSAIQGAMDRGEWGTAETELAGLARTPGAEAAAASLAEELAARRLQQTYLATAVPASELVLRRSVPVVYPETALVRGVEGWVDLEFVVDRNGQPQNPVVVEASLPGRFDAAALDAVAQYRYAPFERDGRIYERRLRLRVRFQVQ